MYTVVSVHPTRLDDVVTEFLIMYAVLIMHSNCKYKNYTFIFKSYFQAYYNTECETLEM